MPDNRDASAADLGQTFRDEASALYRFAKRLLGDPSEAEDAVQEAFLKLTKHRDRPDGFVSARAFVFRVVRNVCIDRLRARARRSLIISDEGLDQEVPPGWSTPTPESDVLAAESFRRIAEAMNRLPEVEAEALSLVVVEGLSYQEVAAATGVPVGTVRSRLNRARQSLRAAFKEPSPRVSSASHRATLRGLPRTIQ